MPAASCNVPQRKSPARVAAKVKPLKPLALRFLHVASTPEIGTEPCQLTADVRVQADAAQLQISSTAPDALGFVFGSRRKSLER